MQTDQSSVVIARPLGERGLKSDSASGVRSGSRVGIIGGGPGGYEAATVAARMGATVILIEEHGLGGAAVLSDVVPSKTIIATAEFLTITERAPKLGIDLGTKARPTVDMAAVNERIKTLAFEQSQDIKTTMQNMGVKIVEGRGKLHSAIGPKGTRFIEATHEDGSHELIECDVVLIATGATPRELPTAKPDGERILTWKQLYNLKDLPEHLIVVGSGVTGAEFAGAYQVLGSQVTLISSRDRVLPGEDEDAATLVEETFKRRGMNVLSRSRAEAARVTDDGVIVTLQDGREIEGSHCLLAVGAIPNTKGIGLEEVGVELTESGHIKVDRMSRTTTYRVYAAGDCTKSIPLASVAAQQGRIAMWHALGDAVQPLDLTRIGATIFTAPEVATVGISEEQAKEAGINALVSVLPIARNPRAKMLGIEEGFVKLLSDADSGVVLGGVVVCPRASEQIFPVTLAVTNRLTVDEFASSFTVYPSLSGTVAEVARTLHH